MKVDFDYKAHLEGAPEYLYVSESDHPYGSNPSIKSLRRAYNLIERGCTYIVNKIVRLLEKGFSETNTDAWRYWVGLTEIFLGAFL